MEIFPSSPIPTYPLALESQHMTLTSSFESGKEFRRQLWAYAKRKATLKFDLLSQSNMMTLWNFFNARKGSFDPFWFFWPLSNSDGTWIFYSGEYVGRGNGSTVTFELPGKNTDNSFNQVKNYGFEDGTSGNWGLYVNTGAGAVASGSIISTGVYKGTYSRAIDITNGGTDVSHIQAYTTQSPALNLVSGQKYEVRFSAKAAASRTIQVSVQQNASPWSNYGLSQAGISIVTGWQDYIYPFTANTTASDGRINFQLGNDNNSVYLDEISIRKSSQTDGLVSSPARAYVNGIETYVAFETGAGDAGVDRITFVTAPANGSVVTADFVGQLRMKMRFASDTTSKELFEYVLYKMGLELQEVR